MVKGTRKRVNQKIPKTTPVVIVIVIESHAMTAQRSPSKIARRAKNISAMTTSLVATVPNLSTPPLKLQLTRQTSVTVSVSSASPRTTEPIER